MSARGRRAAAGAICVTVAIACSEPTAPVTPEPHMAAPITKGEPAALTPVAFAQASRAATASSAIDDALDRVIATFPESSSAAELRRALRLLAGALAGSDRIRSERLLDEPQRALRVLQSNPASSGFEAELAVVALALETVLTPSHGDGP